MKAQFEIRLAQPDIGAAEIDLVNQVLLSGTLTGGPMTHRFEELFAELHGSHHAIAFANGTVALAAMLLGLGIGPGDEVIVPSMTFISTATSVLHVGATPVFADVLPDIFNLDPQDVAKKLTARTRAILAVHYGGQAADMDELAEIAARADVVLLEDAAQAHGAMYRGRPVGTLGRAAMFSFTPTKNITTGEGGIVTTGDVDLADRLRLLRNHGQTALYQHAVLGYNWRMTEMQAAMGVAQLSKLDGILARKQENALFLSSRLASIPGLTPPTRRGDRDHVYMLYTVLIDDGRDRVRDSFLSAGIEARLYFPPAHLQPVFSDRRVELPVTESLAERMLSVPFHSLLTQAELSRIADALMSALVA